MESSLGKVPHQRHCLLGNIESYEERFFVRKTGGFSHAIACKGASRLNTSRSPTRRSIALLMFCLFSAGAAVLLGAKFAPLVRAELVFQDVLTSLFKAQVPETGRVVVVSITEASLARLPYRSPINRDFLADTIEKLLASGVSAVGVDVVFHHPTEPSADQRLRDLVLRHASNTVVAVTHSELPTTAAEQEFQARYTTGVSTGNSALPAVNGVVRSYTLGNGTLPSLAGALFAIATGREPDLDVDDDGQILLNYPALVKNKLQLPSFAVEGLDALPAGWLEGKIVLLGGDLPFQDRHRTPYSVLGGEHSDLAGVFIHALALEQMLTANQVKRLPGWVPVGLILIFALLGAWLASSKKSLWLRATYTGAILIGFVVTLVAMFNTSAVLLPSLSPPLALFFSLTLVGVYLGREERSHRQYVQEAFGRYVSPQIVDRIAGTGVARELTRGRREMSFIFTDLQGFTAMSEQMRPESLVEVLQGYFDGLVDIALDHAGTIDKFVGDAIHVFFNAPLDQPDHLQRSLRCALAMAAFADEFQRHQLASGLNFGVTRIGVHSGEAVVGNVGGEKLFSYTAHGDAVNTAARLEAANKYFGTQICISETMADANPDQPCRTVGDLRLRGKLEPVRCYSPDPVAPDLLVDFEAAFALIDTDHAAAVREFGGLAQKWPDDKLVSYHYQRLVQGATSTLIELS